MTLADGAPVADLPDRPDPAASRHLRDLRRQVRVWRRGRADTRLVDAISDAYIAVFSTAMLTSMAVSVVVNVRTVAATCTSLACTDGRAALPWLTGLGLVAGTLGAAGLLGPMLVSPAVGSWLLPAPVDRRALLRPRLAGTAAVAFAVAAVVAVAVAALSGFPGSSVLAYGGCVGAACLLAVGVAAAAQARRLRRLGLVTWTLTALVWAGLVALTADAVPAPASAPPTGWAPVLGVVAVLAVGALALAYAGLPRLARDQLAPGGALLPGLSGALAGLDFALVQDVLVERRWRARSTVRPVRGRGVGGAALVWRELARVRRDPRPVVLLAAALVVPYLGGSLGLGRADLLVTAGTGFLAGIGLFSSLRVLSRTPSLVRCLPLTAAAVRSACVSVPAAVVLVWALCAEPGLQAAAGLTPADAAPLAVAVGVTAVTAAVRFVTGRPPDYRLPLVTSPMGAVPTSLYVSAARGFDALLLGSAPLLLAPSATGAAISLALDGIVLAVLLNRA